MFTENSVTFWFKCKAHCFVVNWPAHLANETYFCFEEGQKRSALLFQTHQHYARSGQSQKARFISTDMVPTAIRPNNTVKQWNWDYLKVPNSCILGHQLKKCGPSRNEISPLGKYFILLSTNLNIFPLALSIKTNLLKFLHILIVRRNCAPVHISKRSTLLKRRMFR